MKNKINTKQSNMTKYIMCILSIMIAFLMIFSLTPQKVVNAEGIDLSDETQVIEKGTGFYKISANLYDALIDAYNYQNPSNPITELKIGTFKYTTSLNLSGKNIDDFNGLYYFKFNSLLELNLSNNSLSGSFQDFEYFNSLKNINLSNNQLTTFKNNFSNVLENVNLSNNNLTSVNLGSLAEDAIINLSFNQLKSFENITFPQTNCTITLTHNFLTDNTPTLENIALNLGLQGVNQNANLTKDDKIKFGTLENVEKLSLYKKNGDEYIFVQDIMPNQELVNLAINSYKIVFVQTGNVFEDILFIVRPKMPTYKMIDENEQIVENASTVIKEKYEIVFEGDGELYYQINNGEILKGNSYKIEQAGSYTITFWQKTDNVDSLKNSVTIISKYFNPLSLIWVLLGVAFFVGMFYFGIKWKNSFTKPKNIKTSKFSSKGFN